VGIRLILPAQGIMVLDIMFVTEKQCPEADGVTMDFYVRTVARLVNKDIFVEALIVLRRVALTGQISKIRMAFRHPVKQR